MILGASPMAIILIVDDEPVILDVLSRFLETGGRTLLLAGSRAEAMAEVERAGGVDVALVDKNLGDGSGLDLARDLRRGRPDVEVILITGYASFDSAVEAVRIGAFDYVAKPVSDYDALNLKVENALEKVRMKREQRALFARLAASEERYRGVFDASSDAILLFEEPGGRIVDANPAALRLYGHSLEAMRARALADLFDPLSPPEVATGALPARSVPARHARADGASFPVEITVSETPLQGSPLRVCSVRDVSERERADEARRALENDLRHAQKMEAIGRLAGGVAHDFSNILAVVLGYSELLLRDIDADDERLRDSVNGIVEAANRAVGVTRQLLTVSRKKLVRPEVLSPNKVFAELNKLLVRAVGERIELATELAPDIWPVRIDADQLAQVLLNLAVNARDAMPDGGRIDVATSNVEVAAGAVGRVAGLAPGRYVALSVRDRGCGMTEEVRARIFEPFFTTKETGTGLGLATVYGIVRQAGGDIRVESEPGRGSTFTVYLPAAPERPAHAPAAPSKARRGRGETVLVAEDEDALRTMLQKVLGDQGYKVLAGRDGEEALAAAKKHDAGIDLLLADLVMPRMSGQELAERLAADAPALKVLFMTGHSDDPGIQESLLHGGLELIQKPFTTQALLKEVRRLLDARPGKLQVVR